MKSYKVQNPILIRFFNRPDKLKKLMKVIKKVRPSKLYLLSDGPRDERDKKLVDEARLIASNIDWTCTVKKKFSKKNLGGALAGYSGIHWFFSSVHQGIVLEDDNIPNISFFKFCDDLLKYYKNDKRIGMITGNNFQNSKWRGNGSYYFSKYIHCWGWASWRRSFSNWKLVPKNWFEIKKKLLKNESYHDKYEEKYWEKIFNKLCTNKKVHWDYSLLLHFWRKKYLTVTPNSNLVSNIGFGEDSTNTKSKYSKFSKMKVNNLERLKYLKKVERDIEADIFTFNNVFGGKNLRFPLSWILFPYQVLSYFFRNIKGMLIKDHYD